MPIDPTTQMSDNGLLAAFAKGHPDATRLLSERLLPKAYAQAFFWLRNQADADDIAQEAFIRLWRMASNCKEDGTKVSTWLYKVVQNLCYARLRRKSSASLSDIGEPEDSKPAAAELLQGKIRANVLYCALTRENRRKLGKDVREKYAAKSRTRDSFEDALRLLRNDSFDVAAFNDVMQQHSAISNSRQSDARMMMVNHLSVMSLEDRSTYADRLEAALNRRRRHKNK